jgi:hypothetical protein
MIDVKQFGKMMIENGKEYSDRTNRLLGNKSKYHFQSNKIHDSGNIDRFNQIQKTIKFKQIICKQATELILYH